VVEARLFNSNLYCQFAAASRGVFHLLPVDSAVSGPSTAVVLQMFVVLYLKVAMVARHVATISRTKTSMFRLRSIHHRLLPDVVPFQLSTPSPARDVILMCVCAFVSVRLRGVFPPRPGAARNWYLQDQALCPRSSGRSKRVDKSAGTLMMLAVSRLRRECRLVVLDRGVSTLLDGARYYEGAAKFN
jgi:hypothetical protein